MGKWASHIHSSSREDDAGTSEVLQGANTITENIGASCEIALLVPLLSCANIVIANLSLESL